MRARHAGFWALLVVLALGSGVWAQPASGDDRSLEFRPVSGVRQERVPGGRLLLAAYAVILLLLGGYVGLLARRAGRVDDEVRRLEGELARHRKEADRS